MTVAEIRQKYLDFFKAKGHAVIPSASLIPENDPTVLFTTAGMHPLVPYLMGQTHPMGTRLADAQKCLRTDDIEEVGDNRHLTFFEMLGNWSLGDYFKPEAIAWSFEFLTSKDCLRLDPQRIYVTVFEGDADAPRDEESIGIWQAQFETLGIAADEGVAFKDEPASGARGPRVYAYPKKKNWWGPAGLTGPCGPDTEIFYDTGLPHDPAFGEICHPNCDCGRFVEIWNNVFMQYDKQADSSFVPLAQKNVDTGMGLERIAAVVQGKRTVFEVETFQGVFSGLASLSGKTYGTDVIVDRSFRIIADHLRAATFIIGDQRGVVPSNVGQGYIVRRLIRRAIREGRRLGITEPFTDKIAMVIIGEFGSHYQELEANHERVTSEMKKEEEKFGKTLEVGLKRLRELVEEKKVKKMIASGNSSVESKEEFFEVMDKDSKYQMNSISGYEAFDLYQSYGFPVEMIREELDKVGFVFNEHEFKEAERKHQELSRTASAGVFKGGLADHSAETTRLHTATHLLHRALKNVLGDHVEQKGSNITAERLRFDFSHPAKMTPEEIQKVEDLVNGAIEQDLPVHFEEMTVEEAKKRGAIGLFEEKYGDKVKVYFVGDGSQNFSSEICGGPHVTHTGELGSFKIQKEEAVSAGVRRIKATVTGQRL